MIPKPVMSFAIPWYISANRRAAANKCDRVHRLNCDALDVPTFICIILGHDGVGVLEKLANKDALKHFLHAVVGSESAHQKARLR
jgi:hypothetical protein